MENSIINVTARTGKVVDEEKCKLLVSEYEDFSFGIFMMCGEQIEYSIVCPEDGL